MSSFYIINLCSLDQCYDRSTGKPSRAHLLLATTVPVGNNCWACPCKTTQADHIMDWFGDDEGHAEFRRRARGAVLASVWQTFSDKVTDLTFPSSLPPPSLMMESLPTEARIAQKERLKKMAEEGKKPKRRKQIVEDGHDDCGDDLSGLRPELHWLGLDCACYKMRLYD